MTPIYIRSDIVFGHLLIYDRGDIILETNDHLIHGILLLSGGVLLCSLIQRGPLYLALSSGVYWFPLPVL